MFGCEYCINVTFGKLDIAYIKAMQKDQDNSNKLI